MKGQCYEHYREHDSGARGMREEGEAGGSEQKAKTQGEGDDKWQGSNDNSKKEAEDAPEGRTGLSDTGRNNQARKTQSEASGMPKRMKGCADLREWGRFMEDPGTMAAITAWNREKDKESEEKHRRQDEEHDFESDSNLSQDTQYEIKVGASRVDVIRNGDGTNGKRAYGQKPSRKN